MAAHGVQDSGGNCPGLPDVVPFELPYLSRLSWELGSRVVDDAEATLRSEWEHEGAAWALSIFEVTANRAVLRLRTPIGRERFYDAASREVASAVPPLEAAPRWHRLT